MKLSKFKLTIVVSVLVIITFIIIYYFAIKKSENKLLEPFISYEYVTGRYFKLYSNVDDYINFGGLLIYDDNGTLINKSPDNFTTSEHSTSMSSDYGVTINNCLKLVIHNNFRTLTDAKNTLPSTGNNYNLDTYLEWNYSNITTTGNKLQNEWWEYDFGKNVNIA